MSTLEQGNRRELGRSAAQHLPSLPFGASLFILFLALAVFAGFNPIGRGLTVEEWEQNVLYSYYPIPLLVLAFLRMGPLRRSSGVASPRATLCVSWLLESLKLALAKFAVTFVVCHAFWIGVGPPEPTPIQPHPLAPRAKLPPPVSTPAELGAAGAIQGVVVDGTGKPVPGALVRMVEVIEGGTFTSPTDPLVLQHYGFGFKPSISVARPHQRLILRSTDSEVHTVSMRGPRGRPIANTPLLPAKEQSLQLATCPGIVSLECTVHRDQEPEAHLAVLCHPFVAITDAQGRFSLTGIPDGQGAVAVWTPLGEARRPVQIEAGVTRRLRLTTKS